MRPTNQRIGLLAAISMLAMSGTQMDAKMAAAARTAGIQQQFGGGYVAYGNPRDCTTHSRNVKKKRRAAHNERQRRK